jgi:hypothetical protein
MHQTYNIFDACPQGKIEAAAPPVVMYTMDAAYIKKCKADVATADEEIAVIQKHITDAESMVVTGMQSWKYKANVVTPKQRERDELIARLKQRVTNLEAKVFHMRSILQTHIEMMELDKEIEELNLQISKDSRLYYTYCPVDFRPMMSTSV